MKLDLQPVKPEFKIDEFEKLFEKPKEKKMAEDKGDQDKKSEDEKKDKKTKSRRKRISW